MYPRPTYVFFFTQRSKVPWTHSRMLAHDLSRHSFVIFLHHLRLGQCHFCVYDDNKIRCEPINWESGLILVLFGTLGAKYIYINKNEEAAKQWRRRASMFDTRKADGYTVYGRLGGRAIRRRARGQGFSEASLNEGTKLRDKCAESPVKSVKGFFSE